MAWIRKNYGVPARRGARIEYRGDGGISAGTIVTSRGQYLGVRFDGGKRIVTLHPTWSVKYLNDTAQAGTRTAVAELIEVATVVEQKLHSIDKDSRCAARLRAALARVGGTK